MKKKTKRASNVLKLMDKDVDYGEAVRRIMIKARVSKKKLEEELDPFI